MIDTIHVTIAGRRFEIQARPAERGYYDRTITELTTLECDNTWQSEEPPYQTPHATQYHALTGGVMEILVALDEEAAWVECPSCHSEIHRDELHDDGTCDCCAAPIATCRVCGCTDDDCSRCVERTGEPCSWVEPDLCSACHRAGDEPAIDDEPPPDVGSHPGAVIREWD